MPDNLARVEKPSDNKAYVCRQDISDAFDWFSGFLNPENTYAAFPVEVTFVRHRNIECEYCTQPAYWLIQRYGVNNG